MMAKPVVGDEEETAMKGRSLFGPAGSGKGEVTRAEAGRASRRFVTCQKST